MTLTVKQHYVPQFYLKNFGNPIYCYDKKNEKSFKTTPKNVAFEPDFYGPDVEDTLSVEKLMAEMEQKWSLAVRELIKKENFYKLQKDSKNELITFMTFQILRTKQFRQDLAGMANYIAGLYLESKGHKRNAVKLSREGEIKHHLNMFTSYPAFATIIQHMKFVVVINRTPIPFWTSDNPINFQNDYPQQPWGNMGLVCRGIEVHFPITPKLTLIAMDPITFRNVPEQHEVFRKRLAKRENYYQVLNSTRFLFSNIRKFQFIRKMFEFSPESKNPEKVRFDILKARQDNKEYIMTIPKKFCRAWSPKKIPTIRYMDGSRRCR